MVFWWDDNIRVRNKIDWFYEEPFRKVLETTPIHNSSHPFKFVVRSSKSLLFDVGFISVIYYIIFYDK